METEKGVKGGRRKKDKIYLTIFIVVAVVVGGLLYWTLQKGIEEIEENGAKIQEAAIKKETGEIDTSNWKTYVNEEYGYSVKVPEGWEEIKVNDKRVIFVKTYKEFSPQVGIKGEIVIDVYSNKRGLSLSDWVNQNDPQDENSIKSTKEIQFGNQKALERIFILELDDVEYRVIYVSINDFVYKIQPNTFARFPSEESEKEYAYLIGQSNQTIEKILETLNFQKEKKSV